jgi:hypothetical protein
MSALAESTPSQQRSLLIIQMGTEAEVFRTLMALKAIHHLYPKVKIHIAVRSETAASVKRIEWIDRVFEAPSNLDPQTTVAVTAQWIDTFTAVSYDILMNWTYSASFAKASGLLCSLVPAFVKLGNYIRSDLTACSFDAWSMYEQAWVKQGIDQDIHVTDLITTQLLTALQIHVGDPAPDVGGAAVTSRYFFQNVTQSLSEAWSTRNHRLRWILIDAKSFKADRLVSFVRSIILRHADVGVAIINGSDSSLSDLPTDRWLQLSGVISTDEMIHVLSGAQWWISAQSQWMDLASLMSVRVLHVTDHSCNADGPYGNGHAVIRMKSIVDVTTNGSIDTLTADELYAVWSYFNSEWFHKGTIALDQHFKNLEVPFYPLQLNVMRSRIRIPQEGGGVTYESVIPAAMNFEAWMSRVRGQMARAWFCGWLPSVETEVNRMPLSPDLIKRVRALRESLVVFERLCAQGKTTAQELSVCAEHIRSGYLMSLEDRDQVDACGKKLAEIEVLMERIVAVEPELACITLIYKVLMHNLNGNELSRLSKETVQAFELLSEGLELMGVYAAATLNRAKPKSVTAIAGQAISAVDLK